MEWNTHAVYFSHNFKKYTIYQKLVTQKKKKKVPGSPATPKNGGCCGNGGEVRGSGRHPATTNENEA